MTEPTKTRPEDQPLPAGGQECVQDALIKLIEDRKQLGIQRYGSVLMTHNGRDAGQDMVEEAVDQAVYAMQVAMELRDLRAALAHVHALAEQWVQAGPPPLGVPLARWWDRRLAELHTAITPAAPEPRWEPDETLDYGPTPPPTADPDATLRTGTTLPEEGTMAVGAPTPDWLLPQQKCPHCDQHPHGNRLDEHVRTAHADLPDCTARIDTTSGALYTCAFKAGHKDGEYGDWHASVFGPGGRYVWNDTAQGAVPHRAGSEAQMEREIAGRIAITDSACGEEQH